MKADCITGKMQGEQKEWKRRESERRTRQKIEKNRSSTEDSGVGMERRGGVEQREGRRKNREKERLKVRTRERKRKRGFAI